MTRRTLRLAYFLFGLLTINTFVAPFLLKQIVDRGEHAGWPPDRPVEWVAFCGVVGTTLVILVALLRILFVSLKASRSVERRQSERGEV
jgi:hypothetical protein